MTEADIGAGGRLGSVDRLQRQIIATENYSGELWWRIVLEDDGG